MSQPAHRRKRKHKVFSMVDFTLTYIHTCKYKWVNMYLWNHIWHKYIFTQNGKQLKKGKPLQTQNSTRLLYVCLLNATAIMTSSAKEKRTRKANYSNDTRINTLEHKKLQKPNKITITTTTPVTTQPLVALRSAGHG